MQPLLNHRAGAEVAILHSGRRAPDDLWTATRERFRTERVSLEDMDEAGPAAPIVVVDCDLFDPDVVTRLRRAFSGARAYGLLFLIDRHHRGQFVQACSLGADHVVDRPLATPKYHAAIDALRARLGLLERRADVKAGIIAGDAALRAVFALSKAPQDATPEALAEVGQPITWAVADAGLQRWAEVVNEHHNATYRHCLLVTGTAVAFGQHLGFREGDIERLLVGSLIHDLGKVAVPVSILEKPAALDADEMALVATHPAVGRDLLIGNGTFSAEMVDLVAHHHEYLDGSGYPDGLSAPDLSDLVRVVTIADIFSALIERRAYRAPLSLGDAYAVLESMHGRLDMALVRAFEPITRRLGRAA